MEFNDHHHLSKRPNFSWTYIDNKHPRDIAGRHQEGTNLPSNTRRKSWTSEYLQLAAGRVTAALASRHCLSSI